MKTSLNGMASILSFEGVVLSTYNDSVGVPTIGIGHTKSAGPPVPTPGMTVTLAEVLDIFRRDIEKYEAQVLAAIKVPLTENQFDALVSWHFNTGRISNSTLTDKLNADDVEGAAKEFPRWNKAGGKVLEGLVNRRKREQAIFQKADYGTDKIPVWERLNGPSTQKTREEVIALLQNAAETAVNAAPEEELSTEELLANPTSALLPKRRPQQSAGVTRAVIDKFKDLLPTDRRHDSVYVVGVRGYYLDTFGKPGENDRNVYDDAILVVEPNGAHNFNGNTDPSRFSTGIARLKSPQAVRYKPGLHGFNRKAGPYPAFRQDSPCTVIRDNKGEDTDSPNHYFWINLHRGANTTTSSAGCQTVPPHQWTEFKTLVDGLLQKFNQQNFFYILVDNADVPKEELAAMSTDLVPVAGADGAKLTAVVSAIETLVGSKEAAKTGDAAPVTVATEEGKTDADGLAVLIAVLQQIQAARTGKTAPADGEPPLTPVNAALGETLGKMLNGKKTVLGTIGLLATTLLPPLQTVIPALAPVSAAVSAAAPILAPLFSALTGWGALGKIDKWFATRT